MTNSKVSAGKDISLTYFISCTLLESSVLQCTYFILVQYRRSCRHSDAACITYATMPGKYEKAVFLILRTMFRIVHILPYSMWDMCPQLGVRFLADSNSWNVNETPNINCEADAQKTEPAGFFWQCSCTHSVACAENFHGGGVGSRLYGGYLFLVCTVCDVTIWRHFHVSKPTFWRSLLT